MTKEEIDDLTLEQYNDIKEQRDKRNAWGVSRKVARKVDGAPCTGEHIRQRQLLSHRKAFSGTRSTFRVSKIHKA